MKSFDLNSIPYYGVGLGLRSEIADKIMENSKEIDVLEITAEHFLNKPKKALERFAGKFKIVSHGLGLSIGSHEGPSEDYLNSVKPVLANTEASYHSDHFAFSGNQTFSLGHFAPLWFTEEWLDVTVKNITKTQGALGLPLILENIASFFEIPESDFGEAEFIKKVCEASGCGLLLDLTNVHINSYNRKTDPYEFLRKLPLNKVVHVHLAGGKINHGWFYDTHSEALVDENEGAWPLLEYVAGHSDIKTVIIERDRNFKDDFEEMILKDIRRARKILKRPKPVSAGG